MGKRVRLGIVAVTVVTSLLTYAFGQESGFTVEMRNAKGENVGTALLLPAEKGIRIQLNLKSLPPGPHAIHVHEKSECEAPDFESAGDHFNPTNKKHGLKNPQGPHAGDMPNVVVKPNGTARVTLHDPRVTLGEGDLSVFANGGTALVIHAKADDMKTDPAGAAGDRIACGVIAK